jgi:hypothetical protein
MATDIGPGTLLICINDAKEYGCIELTKGAIYIVEKNKPRTGPCDSCRKMDAVILKGKPHYYCLCLFRPLNDGDTSLVENEKEFDDFKGSEVKEITPRQTEKV